MVVAVGGAYGKPRPALVVQSNLFVDLPSVILCPLTKDIRTSIEVSRVAVEPSPENGLKEPSQVMIDKIFAAPLQKIGGVIGTADDALMVRVTRSLAVILAIR